MKKIKNFITNHKRNLFFFLFCFLISFLVLFFCSKNSFRYEFNDWLDENAFFTVGKGWAHGLIPYKDLFEQKGPLLYFIFMIGSLFRTTDFLAIFFFEVISMSIFAYFAGKILDLYLTKKAKFIVIPVLVGMICGSNAFVYGGSAEEFCLPIFMISLYYFLRFFTEDQCQISNKTLFINGLLAGMIAMIKYNLLGFHFVFMATIFFVLLWKKQWKKAVKSSFVFLGGMLILPLVFVIYFASVGALSDFFQAYIGYNVNGYSPNQAVSFMAKIKQICLIFVHALRTNPYFSTLIPLGIFYIIFDRKIFYSFALKISLILLIFIFTFGIYFGLVEYTYYPLPLFVFVIFAFIGIMRLIDLQEQEKIRFILLLLIGLVIMGYTIWKSPNIYDKNQKRKDFAQFQFAEIIKKEEAPTLLNYGFLDGGFYLAADILPNVKYFQMQNGSPEKVQELIDIQNSYIIDKKIQFIVTRDIIGNRPIVPTMEDNYEVVKTIQQSFEDIEYVYRLWKLKEN